MLFYRSVFLALLFCLFGYKVKASESPIQYPESLLRQRAEIYQEDIAWNLNEIVLPRLKPNERVALGRVILEVPISGGGLLNYYAARRGDLGVIVMPAESLRFFSDLCTATAWLAANDHSLSTITDYLGMLKYRNSANPPLSQIPPPLDALFIPEDDLKNPQVENRRSACFSTGVVFILAHEVGHLVHGHTGYDGISRSEAQKNEAQADAFAIELFSRMKGDLPLGALYYFTYASYLDPHRGDFNNTADWESHLRETTHPISPERVKALEIGLQQRASRFGANRGNAIKLAEEIGVIADALTDTELQKLLRLQGETIRPRMLKPRKSDFWQVTPPPEVLPKVKFSGYYEGWIGSDADRGVLIKILLEREGEEVFGRYSYAGIGGVIKGRVQGEAISYSWREPGSSGTGQMNGDATTLHGSLKSRDGDLVEFEIERKQ